MYHLGLICMLVSVLNARGTSLIEENRKLAKTNRALVKALKELQTEKQVGMSDVCPSNGEWVNSGFTTSTPMQGMDSVNTCMNAGLTMAEGVKLSVMNGNMVYVCCVPRSGAERAVGRSGDCTTVEITHGCTTIMKQMGPTCECLVESKVGQYDWQGYGCFNEIKKSCKGDRRFNIDWFNRETQERPYTDRNLDGWCQKQCEYFAVEGCCQYDYDTNKCWFVFDGVVQDDDYSKRYYSSVLGQGPSTYDYVYQRYAGMCKWKGNKKMVDYNRESGCDWNGIDKVGQKQMSGSNISDFDCTAFCFDDPECNFAQVKDGQCRTFQQCHDENSLANYGYTMWQKIDTYVYDY